MEEKQTLKDKCRSYQEKSNYFLDTDKWIIVHVDGRSFSKKIKNRFEKPFDETFINAMNETAVYLCENIEGARMAYVQSDEISLLIHKKTEKSDIFFNGRLCKLQSIIASLATCKFNKLMLSSKIIQNLYKDDGYKISDMYKDVVEQDLYQFDCKAWNVDNQNDAIAWILYRNIDCVRNSKQQSAQTYLSHSQLCNKNTDEQISMLKELKGIDWETYDIGVKYGRIICKEEVACFSENGNTLREKFVIKPGCDLTKEENRLKLIETCGLNLEKEN